MNILGICDNHDSGAALIKGSGEIIATNEERENRVKCSGGFPVMSINRVLEIGGLDISGIDVVALASRMTPMVAFRRLNRLHARLRKEVSQFGYPFHLYILYQVFAHKTVVIEDIESFLSFLWLKNHPFLKRSNPDIKCVEHHCAHAYSGFMTSGLEKEALIFTIDSMGDGVTVTVNKGSPEGKIKRLYEQCGFSSIGTYYSRITEYLGFKPVRDEGKITGLAAYGDYSKAYAQACGIMSFKGEGFSRNNYFLKHGKNTGGYRGISGLSKEDIAAAFQKNLENEVNKFVSYWINKTGIHDIVLSGGLFANVKLNQRIHEIPGVNSIYIFPHMGDGGLALGAALSFLGRGPIKLKDVYFGPEYSSVEIESSIKRAGLICRYFADIEKEAALLLSRGKVLARFNGRMEYGPRALGNRSIIYQATDPNVRQWLNDRLKRTDFMPFAPSTLVEYAGRCYLNIKGAEYTARFLNISFDCTDWMKEKCPGAVHVDGTARPQFVREEDNPSFYRILSQYHKLTGIPTVINTSFNMHEEPIVCSPDDALKAFQESRLDYMAMGNFLVYGRGNVK